MQNFYFEWLLNRNEFYIWLAEIAFCVQVDNTKYILCLHDLKIITLEFFPNEFHRIQQIKWIITKSINGMVTRGITHLATNTLPVVVEIQSTFPLLRQGRYPLPDTTLKKYHPRFSNGNFFFTTTSRIISIVKYGVSVIIILLWDLLSVQWSHLGKT